MQRRCPPPRAPPSPATTLRGASPSTAAAAPRAARMRPVRSMDGVVGAAVERGEVPGVVAMAATRDGVIYEGAFGRRALPDGAAMTADTVFWLASMTKAITSTAALQLVEKGRL